MKLFLHTLVVSFFLVNNIVSGSAVCQWSTQDIDPYTKRLTLQFNLKHTDYIYAHLLSISCDHPSLILNSSVVSHPPHIVYDSIFRDMQPVYYDGDTLQLEVTAAHLPLETPAHIQVSVYPKSLQQFIHQSWAIPFETRDFSMPSSSEPSLPAENIATENIPLTCGIRTKTTFSWAEKISQSLKSSHSRPIQMGLSFGLGVLVSFTPCIYPMIPITAGILQSHAQASLLTNLGLCGAYTLGIASTFAGLGLIAAHTGQLFNKLCHSPIVILLLVVLLLYLAFSMLGFYEMYIPTSLQTTTRRARVGGSFISAFLFGALSGTVASPCLSPGLVLLLSIVLAIGNKLIGFLLLFSFGVGLSVPLLLIGSFSSSLQFLPRAGLWMVEVKRLCGFMLLGSSGYLLSSIVPLPVILLIATIGLFILGIWYLALARSTPNRIAFFQRFIGTTLIALAVVCGFKTYQALFPVTQECGYTSFWETDYQCAKERAVQQDKLLFVDIGAPNCSLCTAIDHTILSDPRVINALSQFVSVKINSANDDASCSYLQKKYTIFGVPTLLLINPRTEEVIARWGGELYTTPVETFIKELNAKLPK